MQEQNNKLPFRFKRNKALQEVQNASWLAIEETIKGESTNTPIVKKHISAFALIAIGLILVSGIWYWSTRSEDAKITTIATNYGEIKTVTLPDSSVITLNGKSSIRVPEKWKKDGIREVWLEGEAYFNIKHLNKDKNQVRNSDRFLVHGEDITVEVLGTSFDIRQRRGKTEVVLQEGSIQLALKDNAQQKIILKPGEFFSFSKKDKKILQAITAEPHNYTAWKEKKLILNNPTVEEIIYYLEDNYGKKIVLKDAEKKHVKIEGPILLTNLDDALFVVSLVLKADVEKRDSTIILKTR